ncbi:MAG: NAD(P)H-dependent glycerol-3-phosphate dehydrogenase [bacterium]
MSEQKITILGAGAWGTAIATLLAHNDHHVTLWCHEPEITYEITKQHTNSQYLPDITLSPKINATTNLEEAITGASLIFEAIPVKFLRQIIEQVLATDPTCRHPRLACPSCFDKLSMSTHPAVPGEASREAWEPVEGRAPSWVILSKGIEQKTRLLPSQIIQDVLKAPINYAVLGGPSFAKELADRQFTTATIASTNSKLITQLDTLLNNNYFKTFPSQDPIGTQICGAIKNVFALIIGIAYGSGHKENTASYLITQGLREIAYLIKHLGGDPQTAYGLSGLGDLILSCTGTLGKNLKAGRLLAQDRSIENLSLNFKTLPEGLNTLLSLRELIERDNLHMPLCHAAYKFIFQNEPFSIFLDQKQR